MCRAKEWRASRAAPPAACVVPPVAALPISTVRQLRVADVYPEHLDTKGYNAIGLYSVANCWVSNVRIVNADNGVQVSQVSCRCRSAQSSSVSLNALATCQACALLAAVRLCHCPANGALGYQASLDRRHVS